MPSNMIPPGIPWTTAHFLHGMMKLNSAFSYIGVCSLCQASAQRISGIVGQKMRLTMWISWRGIIDPLGHILTLPVSSQLNSMIPTHGLKYSKHLELGEFTLSHLIYHWHSAFRECCEYYNSKMLGYCQVLHCGLSHPLLWCFTQTPVV